MSQLSEVENLRKAVQGEKAKIVKMGQDLDKKGLDYYNNTPIDDLLVVRPARLALRNLSSAPTHVCRRRGQVQFLPLHGDFLFSGPSRDRPASTGGDR